MTTERELREQEEKDVDRFLKEEYEPRSLVENLITIGVIAAIVIAILVILG